MAISKFSSGDFGKKISVVQVPPVFLSLKKGTGTLNFGWNEPSLDILWPLGRYDHP